MCRNPYFHRYNGPLFPAVRQVAFDWYNREHPRASVPVTMTSERGQELMKELPWKMPESVRLAGLEQLWQEILAAKTPKPLTITVHAEWDESRIRHVVKQGAFGAIGQPVALGSAFVDELQWLCHGRDVTPYLKRLEEKLSHHVRESLESLADQAIQCRRACLAQAAGEGRPAPAPLCVKRRCWDVLATVEVVSERTLQKQRAHDLARQAEERRKARSRALRPWLWAGAITFILILLYLSK